MTDPTDYRELFLRAEEGRKQAEEERKREAELRRQAEERQAQAEEGERQQRELNRRTTFKEFVQLCHDLISRTLRAETPSRSTTGKIPAPTGKCCPLRFEPWTDCLTKQQTIYNSVCSYLQPVGRDAPQLFSSLIALEDIGQRFVHRPISSEKALEGYEKIAVEDHVQAIISELCKIPSARDEFQLGDGVWFDNHTNALDEIEEDDPQANRQSNSKSRPDQFCIHRVDDNTNTLLTTVEYKPPHKLSVENLRAGLQPIDFYDEIVRLDTTPTDGPEKLKYNATLLTGSAIVQEYHVMIQEGLEYSYLTTGLGHVQLWVPFDDPSTLYYDLCEPNLDVDADARRFQGSKTEIERVLCLCLMSFHSQIRDQAWRNAARAQLPIWKTSFDHTRSHIPKEELQQNPPGSEYDSFEYTSSEKTVSEYLPSSSPAESPAQRRRGTTRFVTGCAPSNAINKEDSPDSDDPTASAGRKRGFSQVTSSPPTQRSQRSTSTRQLNTQRTRGAQYHQHDNEFCTQRCLLGLQQGGALDARCPNVEHHQSGGSWHQHPIDMEELVQIVKKQLDENLDRNCTPMGDCGSYGAPFKITCAAYGYTVVGKGTTSRLWKEVSHEAEIYSILRRVQGSAVPVFLGMIDLAHIYFLHGAGEIRHMLLMGWGGNSVGSIKHNGNIQRAISRSKKKIHSLGVLHQDLRPENILWNPELEKALVIDFHRCKLDHRLMSRKPQSLKRSLSGTEECEVKRVRVT